MRDRWRADRREGRGCRTRPTSSFRERRFRGAFRMTPATNALQIAVEPPIEPSSAFQEAARVRAEEGVAANANLRRPTGRARDNPGCVVARATRPSKSTTAGVALWLPACAL